MLAWWRDIGPAFCQEPWQETLAEDKEWPPKTVLAETYRDWCMLKAGGNNGFFLMVQALM
jgi:hypothetical protein